MSIKIISIRELNHRDWKSMSDDIKDLLYISDLDATKSKDIDQELSDMSCTKAKLTIDGGNFIAYHGFPGDNVSALLLSLDGKIITSFGECGDNKVHKNCPQKYKEAGKIFLKWYNEDADDISCKYFTVKKSTDDEDDEDDQET